MRLHAVSITNIPTLPPPSRGQHPLQPGPLAGPVRASRHVQQATCPEGASRPRLVGDQCRRPLGPLQLPLFDLDPSPAQQRLTGSARGVGRLGRAPTVRPGPLIGAAQDHVRRTPAAPCGRGRSIPSLRIRERSILALILSRWAALSRASICQQVCSSMVQMW